MDWISVHDELPPDNEPLLVLCWGHFAEKCNDYFGQTMTYKIFEGRFSRDRGWYVYDSIGATDKKYWMKRPLDPKEKDELRDNTVSVPMV